MPGETVALMTTLLQKSGTWVFGESVTCHVLKTKIRHIPAADGEVASGLVLLMECLLTAGGRHYGCGSGRIHRSAPVH